MVYAKKRTGKRVKAYELGGGNAVELELLRACKIVLDGDGNYNLFSSEAVNGSGEIAERGDFFKVDSHGAPYPNKRGWFLENHRHIFGDEYEQLPKVLPIWQVGDAVCPELEFLINAGKLQLNTKSAARYFNAFIWGSRLSAASDAVIVFYEIQRDEHGEISNVDFGLVDRKIFERDYELAL